MGKLAEESRSYPDVKSFLHTAIDNNATINAIYQKLKEVLDVQEEDTELWKFLKTLFFRTIEQETIRKYTLLYLSSIATNADAALDAVLELVAKANAGRKKLDWNQDVLTLPSSPARMFLKNSQRTVYYWLLYII